MSFRDTYMLEWVETIRGEDIVFPLLEIDDYVPWTAELHTERMKADAKAIARETNTVERVRLTRASQKDVPDLQYISSMMYTVPAAKKVLTMSLTKVGKSDEECAAIIKKIRPGRLIDLAITVSALFDIARDLPKEPDKTDPNGGEADPPAE